MYRIVCNPELLLNIHLLLFLEQCANVDLNAYSAIKYTVLNFAPWNVCMSQCVSNYSNPCWYCSLVSFPVTATRCNNYLHWSMKSLTIHELGDWKRGILSGEQDQILNAYNSKYYIYIYTYKHVYLIKCTVIINHQEKTLHLKDCIKVWFWLWIYGLLR